MTLHTHESSIERDRMKIGFSHTGIDNAEHTLVMLHGLASNATRWREYMQQSTLRDRFRLIAIDLRGHGHSLTFTRYTRQDWVEDVHYLCASQSQRSVILAGHSLGAQIALEYAARYGDDSVARIRGLVLIDPVFPQALDGVLKLVARLRPLLKMLYWVVRGCYALGLRQRQYPYRDLQALDQKTRELLRTNPHKSIAELYMNPLADLKYIPLANYLQDLYEVTRPLMPLVNIRVPVLVLLSAGASTSQVAQNRKILEQIPNLDIRTIEADHWLLTEKPDEARATIDAWCRKICGYDE